MAPEIIIRKLDSSETDFISIIAKWYLQEWDTPLNKTFQRLSNLSNDFIPLQLVAIQEDQLVATVGLYHHVNLLHSFVRFQQLGPWIGLLYTHKCHRNNGFATMLLDSIEIHAKRMGYPKIYLYTFTAQSLYRKCGWEQIEEVDYKNHPTVIMRKNLRTS